MEPSAVHIVDAALGGEHTLLTDSEGRVFTCGLTDNGRLGLGAATDAREQPIPAHVSLGARAEHVAAGEYHSLVSTADHKVFAFGSGSVGQLGLGINSDQSQPVEIPYFSQLRKAIIGLAAGETHSAVLLEGGSVHTFGLDENHALGTSANGLRASSSSATKHTERYGFAVRGAKARSVPRVVDALREPTVQVAAGAHHTLFLSNSGVVYGCGSNSSGQLGMGTIAKSTVPRKVPLSAASPASASPIESPASPVVVAPDVITATPIVAIASGSHHTVLLSQTGSVLVTGSNTEGCIGLGRDVTHVTSPTIPLLATGEPLPPIAAIACGSTHTVLLPAGQPNVVFVAGWGKSGRLGTGTLDSQYHFLPIAVPASPTGSPVQSIRCGSHHTALLRADGTVALCGCGGRGQLGNGLAQDSAVFHEATQHVAHGPAPPAPHPESIPEASIDPNAVADAQLASIAPSPVDPRHHEINEYARRIQDASTPPLGGGWDEGVKIQMEGSVLMDDGSVSEGSRSSRLNSPASEGLPSPAAESVAAPRVLPRPAP